jgi:UDP-glucose 4-epimerase
LLAKIGDQPQPEKLRVINGGSGLGTSVAEVANLLVKHWGGDVTVGYSGVVRAGDPFSLLADDGGLRKLAFDWQIPVGRGLEDYVRWFKGQTVG